MVVSTGDDFDKDESPAYKAIIRKAFGNMIASTNRWKSTWNFTGLGLDDTDAATLAQGLDGNTIIREIDITSNHFTEVGLQELAKMMENNSTITSVVLREISGVDEEESAACEAITLKCRQNEVSCCLHASQGIPHPAQSPIDPSVL